MKKYITKTKEIKEVESVICDCCKKEFDDIYDIQEFLEIDFYGGYSSIFGDGNRVKSDICQGCVRDLLGKFLTIT